MSKFLRLTEVTARVGLAESTVYAKVATKEFPAPVKIGPRASAWLEEEIERWIADRVAASRGVKSGASRHSTDGNPAPSLADTAYGSPITSAAKRRGGRQ